MVHLPEGSMPDYDAFYDRSARTQLNAAAAILDTHPDGTLRMAKNAKGLLAQMTKKPADYKALSAQIEDLAKQANAKGDVLDKAHKAAVKAKAKP